MSLSLPVFSSTAHALEHAGFGSFWFCLSGSRAQTKYLWIMGLVALPYVGSSQIRDQTYISCIGRQIVYLWALKEALLRPWYLGFHITLTLVFFKYFKFDPEYV